MPRYKKPNVDLGEFDDKMEDVLDMLENDETFHLGQSYEDHAATTLACKKCGSREFNVGTGHYYTAIKCPYCGWEVCIHDG